ncbi:MAG: dienelactone hydrolase family protein [Fimbriimonadaceae bacterium]|nr:dienelactone hydrolase family protein [Fimbriimonadaceae bacterium]
MNLGATPIAGLNLVSHARTGYSDWLLILLHGYGSNESDLFALGETIAPPTDILAIRAQLELGPGQYAWFPLEWTEDGVSWQDADVIGAMTRLSVQIASVYRPRRTILGGFSQGGMMALGLAEHEPSAYAGVLALSSRYPFGEVAPKRVLPPTYLQHGTEDEIIPFGEFRRTESALSQSGTPLTSHAFEMGHEIRRECIAPIRAWLTEIAK